MTTATARPDLAGIVSRDRYVRSQKGVIPTPAVKDRSDLLELLREARKHIATLTGWDEYDSDWSRYQREAKTYLVALAALDEGETR